MCWRARQSLTYAGMLLVIAPFAPGCDTANDRFPGGEVEQIRIHEQYGTEGSRGVKISANLIPDPEGDEITLAQVKVITTPPSAPSSRKLEAVLSDAAFIRSEGDWPLEIVRASPEVLPFAQRFQIAAALLQNTPLETPLEIITTGLFQENPSMAITRIRQDDRNFQIQSMSLVSSGGQSVVSWSQVGGEVQDGELRLSGKRSSLNGQAPETISMTMSRSKVAMAPDG